MNTWNVELKKYNSYENRKYETIFTLANGYKGIRGAIEFSEIGNRGNIISGVFDKGNGQVTEIVNCPDPLGFNIYIDREKVDIDRCTINEFNRSLNMKQGILNSYYDITTENGKRIVIKSERFLSKKNVHRLGNKYEIVSGNFRGKILIENYIDGRVTNGAWDLMERNKHFNVTDLYDISQGIGLRCKTIDNEIEILELSKLVFKNKNNLNNRKLDKLGERYQKFMKQLFRKVKN